MNTTSFDWPKAITADRQFLAGGAVAYYLQHSALGELGRLVLTPVPGGGSNLTCEVLTKGTVEEIERRRLVIEPLGLKVSTVLGGR